jgi:uracil-DNA glycosylase family 4
VTIGLLTKTLNEEQGIEEYKDVTVVRGPACHHKGVLGYGNINGGVVFIGISPARHEVTKSRRPLTGPSGEMLNACLTALDLSRSDYYCTNLVCTWMDEPDESSILSCRARLEHELRVIKPKLIVLLGTIVTEYFTGRKFGKVRGAVQWNTDYDCYVMGTYHPSAIIRSMGDYGSSKDDKASKMIYDFIRDLKKIPDVVKWEVGAPEAQIRYRVVNSIEQAQNVLDNLPRDIPVAIDVETTYGKDDEEVEVFSTDLLCVGVGTDTFAWIFTPSALYTKDGMPALTWPDLCWTMHNSIFDSQVMKLKLDAWLTIREDTMLQSYSLDERSGVHRLKPLTREYLGAGFYEDDRFYGKLKLYEVSKDLLYEYNAKRRSVHCSSLCKVQGTTDRRQCSWLL